MNCKFTLYATETLTQCLQSSINSNCTEHWIYRSWVWQIAMLAQMFSFHLSLLLWDNIFCQIFPPAHLASLIALVPISLYSCGKMQHRLCFNTYFQEKSDLTYRGEQYSWVRVTTNVFCVLAHFASWPRLTWLPWLFSHCMEYSIIAL